MQAVPGLPLCALSSRGEAAVPGYWTGFRRGGGLTLPPTLTLQQVWQDTAGFYLFCVRTPLDSAAFLAVPDDWLAANSPSGEARETLTAQGTDSPWPTGLVGSVSPDSGAERDGAFDYSLTPAFGLVRYRDPTELAPTMTMPRGGQRTWRPTTRC